MTNRQLISKANPEGLQSLATALRQVVEDLHSVLLPIFQAYRRQDAGPTVATITEQLFDRWCAESGTAPLSRVIDDVVKRHRTNTYTVDAFKTLLTNHNFPRDISSEVADRLAALSTSGSWTPDRAAETCWALYDTAVEKYCIQTGHVLMGRMLLYRIGEDTSEGAFPERISGKTLSTSLTSPAMGVPPRDSPLAMFEQVRVHGESFLPAVYRLGEFDWWFIPSDKRSVLDPTSRANVATLDSDLNLALARAFRTLDQYHFENIDVDVWRNIYQHYMPSEERQRLGGFYTPDELVEVVLDSVGYTVDTPGLATKTFIDLASGSGAFAVGALSRLLLHMRKHGVPGLPSGKQPDWVRDEHELRAVQACLHAIDIHPFASFLTTVNVLFMVLPRYLNVKQKNPQFTFEPVVVAHDSLITTQTEARFALSLQTQMNGRIERATQDTKQYLELLKIQFDFVIGNPPWSGILKGPLAAIYDEQQKARLKQAYPAVAMGKYDIYGLFMVRALRSLKDGGIFGLVTQDTYMEKKWASGLRRFLANDSTIECLIDLNPFGQLFFHAQNTPAITIIRKERPATDHEVLLVVATRNFNFKGLDEQARRTEVLRTLTDVIAATIEARSATRGFFTGFLLPQERLRAPNPSRWNLSPANKQTPPSRGIPLSALLTTSQGVTPGGEGCLDLFLIEKAAAEALSLDPDLLHPVVKGQDVVPFACKKTGKVILYPYKLGRACTIPAFDLAAWKSKQSGTITPGLRGLADALDFDAVIDSQERDYRKHGELDAAVLTKILTHRRGLGLVDYANTAEYLIQHYTTLERRIFDKKGIRDWNKRWYEYHRPRKIPIILAKPKIISPRLTPHVCFALDTVGIVPQDSCLALLPSSHTSVAWGAFVNEVSALLGTANDNVSALKVILAFLNSEMADEILRTGRKPTPRGHYTIAKDYLADIIIPPPQSKDKIKGLIEAVDILRKRDKSQHEAARHRLNIIVNSLY